MEGVEARGDAGEGVEVVGGVEVFDEGVEEVGGVVLEKLGHYGGGR